MSLKNILKFIASPSRIITTTVIILFAIFIVQLLTVEISHWMTVSAWDKTSEQIVKEPEKELTEEDKKLAIIRDCRKEFLTDGTVLHVKQKSKKKNLKIYDEDTNLLWEGAAKNSPYDFIAWPDRSRGFYWYNQLNRYKAITPKLSRSIQIPVRTKKKTSQIWRYDWDKDYFEGFDANSEKIGYLGSTGFTQSNPKSLQPVRTFKAWCPEESYSPILLWQTKRKMYLINFEKQQLKLLLESPDSDIKVTAWHNIPTSTEKTNQATLPSIQCKTDDGKLYFVTLDPEKTIAIDMPQDWPKDGYRQLSATKAGIFLKNHGTSTKPMPQKYGYSQKLMDQWAEKFWKKPIHRWVELYKVDDQGGLKLIKRYDWTTPPRKYRPRPAIYRRDTIRHYIHSVSPELYDLPWKIYGPSLRKVYRGNNDFLSGLLEITYMARPHSSKLSWVLTIVMMSLVLLHAWPRRTTWHRLIFWVIFAAVFNLAGLLTYLALNHTTVIKCPACKKRRGLERTDCIRCTAELPAPEKRKTDLILHA